MLKIFKYLLQPLTRQGLHLPKDAVVLTAQMQGSDLCLWVQMEDTRPCTELRMFEVYATGDDLPNEPRRYIATVQRGHYVWHVYESTP